MKPWFHLWILKPKSSQSSGCTHIHIINNPKKFKQMLPTKKLMALLSGTGKECWLWNSCNMGTQYHQKCNVKHWKNYTGSAIWCSAPPRQCTSIYSCLYSNTARAFQLGVVWPPSLQPWSHSKQQWVDGRCQNVAELTGDRLLWHRRTKLNPQYKCLSLGGDFFEK
jgi:hypothetical protein